MTPDTPVVFPVQKIFYIITNIFKKEIKKALLLKRAIAPSFFRIDTDACPAAAAYFFSRPGGTACRAAAQPSIIINQGISAAYVMKNAMPLFH